MKNIFEKERVAFIAAMIRGDMDAAQTLLAGVHARVQALSPLTEADQKAINQMLVAAKKIGPPSRNTTGQTLRQTRERLKTAMAQVIRAKVRSVEYSGYADWRESLGLDDGRYRVMLENVATCQLSVGCSNFCRRCNEWALAGVRRHFSFEAAQRIVKDLHAAGNDRYALYCASDPLDYRCGDRTIADLLRYMQKQGYTTRFGLLTKVPRGSESLAQHFLEEEVDIAVSLTEKNKSRVARLEKRAGKKFKAQHDTVELMIPAGLDEDFSTVKPSITDNYGIELTPEAAWMVIPTFTSALQPTGQCRFPVTAASDWFVKKRVGRDALPVEYFKPLSVCGKDGRAFVLDHLLPPQIENILLDNGDEALTPPGMMNLAEYFKTFDPAVVRHRKRLAPVAIENLRRQVFQADGRMGHDRQALETAFANKKKDYLDFCDLERVAGFKHKAFGYFLAAVADYLKTHPAEREIVRYLRGEAAPAWNENMGGENQPGMTLVDTLLSDAGMNTFDCFSYLLHRLLTNPADDALAAFFTATPASYDPESDRFV